MGLFDKFKKNSKNEKKENEIINASGWDAIDEEGNGIDSVFEIMKKYEVKGNFAHSLVDETMITDAEKRLGVKLPEAYKKFLKEFGVGGLDGVETLGVAKNGRIVFADTTIELRKLGMPDNLIAIEDCDEWWYCIEKKSQKIVSWALEDGSSYKEEFPDFESYLSDRMNDAIDNL